MSVVVSARVSDDVAAGFDAAAAAAGGRSALLRRLIREASGAAAGPAEGRRRQPRDAARIMVRLAPPEAGHVARQAAAMALPRAAWVAALVAAHGRGAPRFPRPDALALIAIHGELRRIGVNVNQIARALNTAVMEGRVLDTELGAIEELRREVRGHVGALGAAFAGNLAYWAAEL